jgi:hypothetical protein
VAGQSRISGCTDGEHVDPQVGVPITLTSLRAGRGSAPRAVERERVQSEQLDHASITPSPPRSAPDPPVRRARRCGRPTATRQDGRRKEREERVLTMKSTVSGQIDGGVMPSSRSTVELRAMMEFVLLHVVEDPARSSWFGAVGALARASS